MPAKQPTISERIAQVDPVARRRTTARIFPLLLALVVGIPPAAKAQGWSGSLSNSQTGGAGDLSTLVRCEGYVWNDDPSYSVYISGNLHVNNQLVDQRTTWGLGTAHLEPSLQTTLWIGRNTDYRVTCFLSSPFGSGWVEPALQYPPRTPTSLAVDVDTFTSYGFANYERYREYRVVDNYGFNYGYTDAAVTESFSPISNGCNLQVETGQAYLNSQGKFADRYTTFGQSIPACGVDPNCSSSFLQTHNVDSKKSFTRNVTYTCYTVEVGQYT